MKLIFFRSWHFSLKHLFCRKIFPNEIIVLPTDRHYLFNHKALRRDLGKGGGAKQILFYYLNYFNPKSFLKALNTSLGVVFHSRLVGFFFTFHFNRMSMKWVFLRLINLSMRVSAKDLLLGTLLFYVHQ